MNNLFQVGQIDNTSTNGDDGMGVLTTFGTSVSVNSLTVANNTFHPLNASGNRAFYVNPGVGSFTFQGNTITGEFDGTSITQAHNGVVQDNTVTDHISTNSFLSDNQYGVVNTCDGIINHCTETNGDLASPAERAALPRCTWRASGPSERIAARGDRRRSIEGGPWADWLAGERLRSGSKRTDRAARERTQRTAAAARSRPSTCARRGQQT